MVHLLALRRAELHLINQVRGRAGFQALRFLAWSRRTPSGARTQARKEAKWLAKIRERNRKNQAALDSRKTRRRQSKQSRARNGWLTFAGTTARRISSSPGGNGSPVGVAVHWFTPRKIAPTERNFPRQRRQFSACLVINSRRSHSALPHCTPAVNLLFVCSMS
jgi:hypothetical protein